MRLNLDMLRTRTRERILRDAFIEAKQAFVADGTNGTVAERSAHIEPAKQAGFRVVGYYFESRVSPALDRNAGRANPVPHKGVLGQAARLQRPAMGEGFDALYYVRLIDGGFEVMEWIDEV